MHPPEGDGKNYQIAIKYELTFFGYKSRILSIHYAPVRLCVSVENIF